MFKGVGSWGAYNLRNYIVDIPNLIKSMLLHLKMISTKAFHLKFRLSTLPLG